MFSDKLFQAAFFISLFAHAVILLQKPNFNFSSPNNKPEKVEISYVNNQKEDRQDPRHRPLLKLPSTASPVRRPLPPFVDKQEVFGKDREAIGSTPELVKPSLIKSDVVALVKKINFLPVEMNKSGNPSYISYYQLVREKIRRAAYDNYTRTETGEIYLSFVISQDGYLKDVRIVEEKSSFSSYLREITLRSVKDASPFPNFPNNLAYPELSFNVIVSFETE